MTFKLFAELHGLTFQDLWPDGTFIAMALSFSKSLLSLSSLELLVGLNALLRTPACTELQP